MTFTDQNFGKEVLKSETPVLVDFWAPWCGPCQMVEPIIEELAKELDGKIKVGKINVDENPKIAAKYGIMSIPTVILFKEGKEVIRKVGFEGKEAYLEIISNI
ncbi:thioredoxin [Candidatus Woesebacteria bacterium CG_4_10_14_0_2_um_filter_39_14]|uniref:Thioredoxin n=3 Tax=Microgenomates group TaxID=1794810 RepID=A0A2M6YPV8_9BACT|nr:MAG: thioredoxin [Candidatus Shapirobacteria bacterium CG07_land_8_20_14_0_80_39_12]PIZ49925.1 MAG: thioredoxin [Candidatus Woesebacteria bacterium CG_4_10_14_0_2_um_filter_39_14]PJA49405.1 MAG: thioredoxin [Candidatus Shapirobacteria bacterium CG_4_9_14_3_um_filter_39_13]